MNGDLMCDRVYTDLVSMSASMIDVGNELNDTAVTNCCANCVEISNGGCPIYRF